MFSGYLLVGERVDGAQQAQAQAHKHEQSSGDWKDGLAVAWREND